MRKNSDYESFNANFFSFLSIAKAAKAVAAPKKVAAKKKPAWDDGSDEGVNMAPPLPKIVQEAPKLP